jgi:hypothetical protein
VVELSERVETAAIASPDPYNPERRYERRFPQTAVLMPQFLQGYERNRESACAILGFLDQHFDVHPAMKEAILSLAFSSFIE